MTLTEFPFDVSERKGGRSNFLISSLADRSPAVRERAATAIFTLGQRQALSRAEKWLQDIEFAKLVVFTPLDVPRFTVGIAVEPPTFEAIHKANGSPRFSEVPPDIDAREFELDFGRNVRVDVLTTRTSEEGGAIARFLKKFGEGIQQVEMEVKDADRAGALLRERFGMAMVYPEARAGANGTQVNFFLAQDETGAKLLIELVEVPRLR